MNQSRTQFGTRMAPSWWCLLLCPALVSSAAAQPPPLFEPKDHYYKAQGTGITVAWKLDRTEVPEGGELLATLTIRGATNPHEIVRPDLRKLPPFAKDFVIEDVPAPPAKPKDKEVAFVYRLRPRDRTVKRVPTLDFFYFNPAADKNNPFPKTTAKGIAIEVTEAAAKVVPKIPLDAPDRLFEITTGPRVLDRAPFVPGCGTWLLLLLGVPVAAGGWYLAWRRVFPDGARLAHLRRTRAAKRALAGVRNAHHTPDPAGAITAAVLGYLRARFPLPVGAETPPEIAEGLRQAGAKDEDVAAAELFFRAGDAARFGVMTDTVPSLAAAAEGLIARLEAAE